MHFSNFALVAVVGYASGIAAHGIVKEIEAGGKSIEGYKPHAWTKVPTPGWSIPRDQDHGFLGSEDYQSSDIICHVGATPGQLSITVAAGESIGLQWTSWPPSHHGNVVNYLANCHGKCEDVDKTKLEFNKMDERGLIYSNPDYPIGKYVDDVTTGYWYGDELIKNGNKAWFKVPEWVAAGNYVLRHELMALHNAMAEGKGIQHYPQCINLIVTGGGSDSLESGTRGIDLYRSDQPGVVVNIFRNPGEYTIPGPKVYKPGNVNAAPKKSSVPPAQKSAAPKEKYSFAPLGESSIAPAKTSAAPERTSAAPEKTAVKTVVMTPVPHVTPSHGVYQNTTVTSSLPRETKVPGSKKHGSYEYTGLDGAEQGPGSVHQTGKVPVVANNDEPSSGDHQQEESSGYNYHLSNNVKSSNDATTGGYTYQTPENLAPHPNKNAASNVQAEANPKKAQHPALDPYVVKLLDLIQKTLNELRQKVLGGNVHKRHARDLGN